MQNDYVEQLTNAGKTSYETLQELGAISAKTWQKLTDLQFKFASFNIETGIEQSKLLSGTTNYKDILSAGSEFASDYNAKAMDFSKQATSILAESRDEFVSWFEKGFEKVEAELPPVKAPTAKRSSKKSETA